MSSMPALDWSIPPFEYLFDEQRCVPALRMIPTRHRFPSPQYDTCEKTLTAVASSSTPQHASKEMFKEMHRGSAIAPVRVCISGRGCDTQLISEQIHTPHGMQGGACCTVPCLRDCDGGRFVR